MIDRKRKGMRCGAKNMIRSREVTIQPANQGTVIYEMENLGRRLILVQWDGGSSTYAFPVAHSKKATIENIFMLRREGRSNQPVVDRI